LSNEDLADFRECFIWALGIAIGFPRTGTIIQMNSKTLRFCDHDHSTIDWKTTLDGTWLFKPTITKNMTSSQRNPSKTFNIPRKCNKLMQFYMQMIRQPLLQRNNKQSEALWIDDKGNAFNQNTMLNTIKSISGEHATTVTISGLRKSICTAFYRMKESSDPEILGEFNHRMDHTPATGARYYNVCQFYDNTAKGNSLDALISLTGGAFDDDDEAEHDDFFEEY
jgi:hypothetical protein